MLKIFVFDQLNVVWTSQFGIAIFQYFWLKVSKYCETQYPWKYFLWLCMCLSIFCVNSLLAKYHKLYKKTLYRWKKQQLYKNICFMSNNEEILKYIDFSKSIPLITAFLWKKSKCMIRSISMTFQAIKKRPKINGAKRNMFLEIPWAELV